jgi:hypothetical protein
MLHIDRVRTELEVLAGHAGEAAPTRSSGEVAPLLAGASLDPAARRQLSELVLDVLGEHLRGLERRGVV